MLNSSQVFNNPEFGSIRVVLKDEEPWFAGKDVAEVLGYKNTKDALANHIDDEDKAIIQRSQITTLNISIPNRGLTIINESGLYSLILSSKLPQAKAFKRWVTSEVLPAIRKHGGYLTPDKVEETLLNPDTIIQLALQLKEERKRSQMLQKDVDHLQGRIDRTSLPYMARQRSKATAKDYAVTTVAKLYDIKRPAFYQLLVDQGWLSNDNAERRYYPTLKSPPGAFYVELGAFKGCPKATVRITPYGLMCIKQVLREKGYLM